MDMECVDLNAELIEDKGCPVLLRVGVLRPCCVDDGSLDVRQVKSKKKLEISPPPVFAPSFFWRPLSFSSSLSLLSL